MLLKFKYSPAMVILAQKIGIILKSNTLIFPKFLKISYSKSTVIKSVKVKITIKTVKITSVVNIVYYA